jgi:hypothetical protein
MHGTMNLKINFFLGEVYSKIHSQGKLDGKRSAG